MKNIKTYKQVLKDSYLVIDTEYVDGVKDYEDILNTLSTLSEGKFLPTIKSMNEQRTTKTVEIEINGRIHLIRLQGDSDYIDLKIIDFANECLIDSGHTKKKFIAFKSTSFDQQVGIAFVGTSMLKALSELRGIRIVRG